MILAGIFFIGAAVGGGGTMALLKAPEPVYKKPYYSPEVFLPPKKSGFGAILGTETKTYHLPILLYHYVEFNKDPKDTIRMGLTVRRDYFEKQIQGLLKEGYTFLTVAEAGEIMDGKRVMPEKPVVLTFDDGYRDFYTDVFPILEFYKIKATLFVVSGFVGRPNNITDPMLREIVSSNLVEIGGHTVNHLALTSLPLEREKKEIVNDKKYLEEKYGIKMVSFAYPYGIFNKETEDLVKEAGYLQAVSVAKGEKQSSENRFYLYRIRPGASTGLYLEKMLSEKR